MNKRTIKKQGVGNLRAHIHISRGSPLFAAALFMAPNLTPLQEINCEIKGRPRARECFFHFIYLRRP
jgi:hypothetical protein